MTMFPRSIVTILFVGALIQPGVGQSVFGHPWGGLRGLDDFHGSRFRGGSPAWYGYDGMHNDDYDDYFDHWNRIACPPYKPLYLSPWTAAAGNKIALQVTLPGVQQQQYMDASLSRDGSAIHVQGLRALPARGRACLPAGAKVSASGRYEILDETIPVPAIGDAQGASVQQFREALRISMPRRAQSPDIASLHERPPVWSRHIDAEAPHGHRRAAESQQSHEGSAASRDVTSKFVNQVHQRAQERAKANVRPAVILPPSTGILVEDAEFPWPEKRADASDDWVDNRGEFQYY